MATDQTGERTGISRGQLATIAGLGAVLVAVVVYQLQPVGELASDKASSATAERRDRGPRRPDKKASAVTTAAVDPERAWPTMSLSEVREFNPFKVSAVLAPPPPAPEVAYRSDDPPPALPDDTAAREAEAKAVLLREIQGSGVELVVIGDGRRVANIGGKMVHIGDLIQGFRVVDIEADGIVLGAGTAEQP